MSRSFSSAITGLVNANVNAEHYSILQFTAHRTQCAKTLVYLPRQETTRVRGDLGSLKIYDDGPVKSYPNRLFLLFTTPMPAIILDDRLLPTTYRAVYRKNILLFVLPLNNPGNL